MEYLVIYSLLSVMWILIAIVLRRTKTGGMIAVAGVLPMVTNIDVSLVNRIYWPFFFIAMIGSVVYVNVSKRFKA